jgi:ABC-type multidrug transport system ATPase subunit
VRVQVETLSKTFGAMQALDDVTLDLPGGQLVALLGPNGAGKTTLVRCLTGLLIPSAGRILYDGQPFDREDLPLRRRLAFMPETPPLEPTRSALDHAGLVLRLYEVPEEPAVERVLELLRRFDMLPSATRPASTLSRGQTYKAGLIPLIACQPDLLILDEPFASGMDPTGLSALKELAREITGRGGTVIYTTQIMDVVERFSDVVCVLHRSRLRGCAPLPELVALHEGGLDALFHQLREEDSQEAESGEPAEAEPAGAVEPADEPPGQPADEPPGEVDG